MRNLSLVVYLATQGVNPKEHPVKQELVRFRGFFLLTCLFVAVFLKLKSQYLHHTDCGELNCLELKL